MSKPKQRILDLAAEGKTDKEIAAKLHISVFTVRYELKHAKPKKCQEPPKPCGHPCETCGKEVHKASRFCLECNELISIGLAVVKVPEPTSTIPGTAERIEVLRRRVERGEALFHPKDRTFENVVGGAVVGVPKGVSLSARESKSVAMPVFKKGLG